MSDGSTTPDLSKIVGLIMENPKLIEEISSLVKKSEREDAEEETVSEAPEKPLAERANAPAETDERSQKRTRLLGALKPYVSKERARAIDSMISIAEMLEVMKAR